MSTSRKGKPIVKKRGKAVVPESSFLTYSIDKAFENFLALKKSLGVRERTFNEYGIIMNWFHEWLSESYAELTNSIHSVIKSSIIPLLNTYGQSLKNCCVQ